MTKLVENDLKHQSNQFFRVSLANTTYLKQNKQRQLLISLITAFRSLFPPWFTNLPNNPLSSVASTLKYLIWSIDLQESPKLPEAALNKQIQRIGVPRFRVLLVGI